MPSRNMHTQRNRRLQNAALISLGAGAAVGAATWGYKKYAADAAFSKKKEEIGKERKEAGAHLLNIARAKNQEVKTEVLNNTGIVDRALGKIAKRAASKGEGIREAMENLKGQFDVLPSERELILEKKMENKREDILATIGIITDLKKSDLKEYLAAKEHAAREREAHNYGLAAGSVSTILVFAAIVLKWNFDGWVKRTNERMQAEALRSKLDARRRKREERAAAAARPEAKRPAPAYVPAPPKNGGQEGLSKRDILAAISETLMPFLGEESEGASKTLLRVLGREVCGQIAKDPERLIELLKEHANEDSGAWRILERILTNEEEPELEAEPDTDRDTPVPTFRPHEMLVFPADLERYVLDKGLNPESVKAAIVYGFNLHTNKKKARGTAYLPLFAIDSNMRRAIDGIEENPELAVKRIADFLHKEGVMGYYKNGTTAMFDPEIGQFFPKTQMGLKIIAAVDKWAFEFRKMQAPK